MFDFGVLNWYHSTSCWEGQVESTRSLLSAGAEPFYPSGKTMSLTPEMLFRKEAAWKEAIDLAHQLKERCALAGLTLDIWFSGGFARHVIAGWRYRDLDFTCAIHTSEGDDRDLRTIFKQTLDIFLALTSNSHCTHKQFCYGNLQILGLKSFCDGKDLDILLYIPKFDDAKIVRYSNTLDAGRIPLNENCFFSLNHADAKDYLFDLQNKNLKMKTEARQYLLRMVHMMGFGCLPQESDVNTAVHDETWVMNYTHHQDLHYEDRWQKEIDLLNLISLERYLDDLDLRKKFRVICTKIPSFPSDVEDHWIFSEGLLIERVLKNEPGIRREKDFIVINQDGFEMYYRCRFALQELAERFFVTSSFLKLTPDRKLELARIFLAAISNKKLFLRYLEESWNDKEKIQHLRIDFYLQQVRESLSTPYTVKALLPYVTKLLLGEDVEAIQFSALFIQAAPEISRNTTFKTLFSKALLLYFKKSKLKYENENALLASLQLMAMAQERELLPAADRFKWFGSNLGKILSVASLRIPICHLERVLKLDRKYVVTYGNILEPIFRKQVINSLQAGDPKGFITYRVLDPEFCIDLPPHDQISAALRYFTQKGCPLEELVPLITILLENGRDPSQVYPYVLEMDLDFLKKYYMPIISVCAAQLEHTLLCRFLLCGIDLKNQLHVSRLLLDLNTNKEFRLSHELLDKFELLAPEIQSHLLPLITDKELFQRVLDSLSKNLTIDCILLYNAITKRNDSAPPSKLLQRLSLIPSFEVLTYVSNSSKGTFAKNIFEKALEIKQEGLAYSQLQYLQKDEVERRHTPGLNWLLQITVDKEAVIIHYERIRILHWISEQTLLLLPWWLYKKTIREIEQKDPPLIGLIEKYVNGNLDWFKSEMLIYDLEQVWEAFTLKRALNRIAGRASNEQFELGIQVLSKISNKKEFEYQLIALRLSRYSSSDMCVKILKGIGKVFNKREQSLKILKTLKGVTNHWVGNKVLIGNDEFFEAYITLLLLIVKIDEKATFEFLLEMEYNFNLYVALMFVLSNKGPPSAVHCSYLLVVIEYMLSRIAKFGFKTATTSYLENFFISMSNCGIKQEEIQRLREKFVDQATKSLAEIKQQILEHSYENYSVLCMRVKNFIYVSNFFIQPEKKEEIAYVIEETLRLFTKEKNGSRIHEILPLIGQASSKFIDLRSPLLCDILEQIFFELWFSADQPFAESQLDPSLFSLALCAQSTKQKKYPLFKVWLTCIFRGFEDPQLYEKGGKALGKIIFNLDPNERTKSKKMLQSMLRVGPFLRECENDHIYNLQDWNSLSSERKKAYVEKFKLFPLLITEALSLFEKGERKKIFAYIEGETYFSNIRCYLNFFKLSSCQIL